MREYAGSLAKHLAGGRATEPGDTVAVLTTTRLDCLLAKGQDGKDAVCVLCMRLCRWV